MHLEFLRLLIATLGTIGLLYLIYWYLKNNPQHLTLMSGFTPVKNETGVSLQIESVIKLDPRKRLHVVRYGDQRFLIATTADKAERISPLDPPTAPPTE